MVDWDRVDALRADGESWSDIAADPKVGFHADAAAGDPGRALRALYHRDRARRARQGPAPAPKRIPVKDRERRWTLVRAAYLVVAVVGVWAALAYAAPSPVGLLVSAIPYLAFALLGAVAVLLYALYRSSERRWNSIIRGTVINGVILGLVFSGMIAVVGVLVFGCPYLPPASAVGSISDSGWHGPNGLPSWTEGGQPVFYFFGATWCPFCSASSWAIWKALSMFGAAPTTLTRSEMGYSSSVDVDAQTPEVIIADLSSGGNSKVAVQVSEDTSGVDGTPPSTSSCVQLAYVTAYSGGSIPFVVIDGKYVHGQVSIIDPTLLKSYEGTGDSAVYNSVRNESGAPWTTAISNQTWWMASFLAKSVGVAPATLKSEYGWTAADLTNVNYDLGQIP